MKENFDGQSYRDNLAKDLKNLRENYDPKLAVGLLKSEKKTERYSEAEIAQIEKRKEVREKSPLLKELRDDNEAKRYESQEKYITGIMEGINEKFPLIEKEVLEKIHAVLGKEKDRFIYEYYMYEGSHSYNRYLHGILDEKYIAEVTNPKSMQGMKNQIIDESLNNKEPYHTTKEAISSFLSHHPEFVEEMGDKKITMIKNGELYFSGDFLQIFSKDKETLLNLMKKDGVQEHFNRRGDWKGYR